MLLQSDLPDEILAMDDDEADTSERSISPPVLRLLFLVKWAFQFHISSAAPGALVVFLYHFLRLLASSTGSDFLQSISIHCPKSVAMVYKLLGIESETFRKYVVCPKCCSVYEMECCFEKQADGRKKSKYCVYIAYPNHPRNSMRKECGALLLQKVVKSTSLYDLRQFRTYVYQPLELALGHLFLRANFLKLTERWRNLPVIDNCFLRDIYCGEVWKEFQCPNGRNFLAAPYSLATMINVDWFQPFTREVFCWCHLSGHSKFAS